MNRYLATFLASLTFTAACAEEPMDEPAEDVVFVAVSADDDVDAEPSVIDYGEFDTRMEEGDYEVGDIWVRDCNLCVRTADGAACTLMECNIDDRSASTTCDGGARAQADVWADDCNLCQCSPTGTVCTAMACEPSVRPSQGAQE
jgi:hypothetical protein